MSSIKDAIVRIGRSIRQVEALTPTKRRSTGSAASNSASADSTVPKEPNPLHYTTLSNEDLSKYTPLITEDYRRKYYQEYLKPLNIPNLKTFQKNRPVYDSQRASENWKRKKLSPSVNYLENRMKFLRMMDLLIELTPDSLKLSNPSISTVYIQNLISRQELESNENQFRAETPIYHFHELPQLYMPTDGGVQSDNDNVSLDFQKYIYFLTHSKCLYKNSSSLENGIIPDILLYTHSLENPEFKSLRSVHTFNYLIRYFGYEKNQSSFARELLLVMNKDGLKPNIDTINNLLRMCKTHSRIRSLSSTYSAVMQYLNLCKDLELQVNLTSWNMVYDSISNIFLKEIFIDKMNSINLPVSRNLYTRILDDFMETTKDEAEVVRFIEEDLKIANWKQDSLISNKVLRFQLRNTKSLGTDIRDLLSENELADSAFTSTDGLVENTESQDRSRIIDEYTFQSLFHHIMFQSKNLTNKAWHAVKLYTYMLQYYPQVKPNPKSFIYLIRGLCLSSTNYCTESLMFLVRALIHEEATEKLGLPIVHKRIMNENNEIVNEGPSENFKIMRLLVGGGVLNELEGRFLYDKGERTGVSILKDPLTDEERLAWNQLKSRFSASKFAFTDSPSDEENILIGKIEEAEDGELTKSKQYANVQKNRSLNATYRNRLERIHKGNFKFTVNKLKERNLIKKAL
ncbi:putative mitochondrial group I intron splicing factor CCM1 [[Candida] railenensis]|uniref:Mitochondrial group I intron splicing factor CCM1 n=1 Tax=[Candida] railenensis TaxID=45579 RepID=A0A9P0QV58_9ASCO|nr:putative mitochondrial group I intron splicing factor CCM1 [[Candida] railenensis]